MTLYELVNCTFGDDSQLSQRCQVDAQVRFTRWFRKRCKCTKWFKIHALFLWKAKTQPSFCDIWAINGLINGQ